MRIIAYVLSESYLTAETTLKSSVVRKTKCRTNNLSWSLVRRLMALLFLASPLFAQGPILAPQTETASGDGAMQYKGVFTNSGYNYNFRTLVNGCSTSAEYSAVHGSGPSATITEGITSCVLYPFGATVPVASAINGYVQSNVAGGTGLAGNFQARCITSNSSCSGANHVVQDISGATGNSLTGEENDIFLKGSSWSSVTGSYVYGDFPSQPASATGYLVDRPNFFGGTGQWTFGFTVEDAATTGRAFAAGLSATGTNNVASQEYAMFSKDSEGRSHEGDMQTNPNGHVCLRDNSTSSCTQTGNGTLALTQQALTQRNALVISDQGTACTNAELALSAGWGSTASVGGVQGTGQTCRWTITSSGSGQAANPTITDTLTNSLPSSSIICTMMMEGGTGRFTMINQYTLSATAPVFAFDGTPVGNDTYIINRRCGP